MVFYSRELQRRITFINSLSKFILMNFQDLKTVGNADFYLDIAIKRTKKYLELSQSRSSKPSDVAKKIRKKIGGDLDEIIKALPAGNIDLK